MIEDRFCYCLDIGDREFWIHTDSSNWIHFDDVKLRRKRRPEGSPNLEAASMFGGDKAKQLLQGEIEHWGVSAPIPDALVSYFEVAYEMFESDNWTVEHEEQLDKHLIPFFWDTINPKLQELIMG